MQIAKAHAYGNDFLYVEAQDVEGRDLPALARRLCVRHTGAGADGLIIYEPTPLGARMELFNADGSLAEISGNGLRGLAALVVHRRGNPEQVIPGAEVAIETVAGPRTLTLVHREGSRCTFRADMGAPEELDRIALDAGGEVVTASVLSMGNPQCVVLGPLPSDERFERLGPAIERHPRFPRGTNVEFAEIVAPAHVRIRIWERGVGATASSGTGTCAAAVAAIAHGGAAPALTVSAPGGDQLVEWQGGPVTLVGWAEVVWQGTWVADL